MTLQLVPPISLGDVIAEYEAPLGTPLGAFVRGGAFVPDSPGNSGVPTTKPISLGDLLGSSNETVFGANRMTAAGGTPPTGYSRGNFGIMTPDTVEGFDWELMQTPITPTFLSIQIRTVTDLGVGYFSEIRYLPTGNDPVWFGHSVKSSEVSFYSHILGVSIWSFNGGPSGAPGFFIQGSLYDFEMVR